jgi:hypothetical protein
MSQLLFIYRKQSKEVVEVRALYRKEAMQRKLLFNEVGVVLYNTKVNFRLLVREKAKILSLHNFCVCIDVSMTSNLKF